MFFRDYFRVLVSLFVLFALYHVTVLPFLEPGPRSTSKSWPSVPTVMRDNWWEDFFQEGDWQRDKENPPRVLKTETATLLFQSREQKSETRWLVKPLTILIPQRDASGKKRAVIIRNNEGAELQFEREVNWTAELPPIVSGLLLGEISIYSPSDDAKKNNEMRISARDLRINKREIWTNQRIRFQYGNSLVEGSDLKIVLDKGLLTSQATGEKKETPFNGLDRMELTYVERVHIGLDPGGLLPRKDIPDIASRQAHATLHCGGSFVFQFHQSTATLSRGVHMEHIVQGLPIDTFDCNELEMTVGWQPNKSNPQPVATADKQPSNWQVERLKAVGSAGKNNSDHSGWLRLNAPGMQAEAIGQFLDMDILNGTFSLSNRLPLSTAREITPVYLKREAVQVWSPEVQYQTAESIAGSAQDPSKTAIPDFKNRLGAVLAQGAGRAQMESNGDTWKLSWGERLLVRPDPNDLAKDLVDIKGSANISSESHGRFRAEYLYLWFNPTAPNSTPPTGNGNAFQWLPDRIEADGMVDVNSPTLRATVEKMQVWFVYPPNEKNPAIAVTSVQAPNSPALNTTTQTTLGGAPANSDRMRASPELNLMPSTRPVQSPLKQPLASRNESKPKGFLSANPASPLVVTAKTMIAKVLRSGEDSRVENMNLNGNFTLTKSQLSDDSPWPVNVTGHSLQLSQTEDGFSDMTIVGLPSNAGTPPKLAKVAVGSGWVVAPEMKLKQGDNQFWIDHPGTFLMPVEVLQQNKSTPPNSTSLVSLPTPLNAARANNGFSPAYPPNIENANTVRWHEAPLLKWGGRMTFDGRTARFGGGVTLDCKMDTDPKTLWHIGASSNQMSVEMEKPVSMSNRVEDASSPPSRISIIRFEDNVDVQVVQTDLQGRRRSMEHMKVPQLDVLVANQLWMAHGPGEILSRRLGNDGSIGGVFSTSATPKPSLPEREADNVKQCIHLSFAGRMEGDMAQRKATFYDRILAMLGPIASWEDALNVHAVDRPGRNQSILNSDRLEIFDASSLSWNQPPNRVPNGKADSAWEIAAIGRVHMQSSTDTGEVNGVGESLKYTAVTDTVRIDGTPQQPAHISANGFEGYIRSASYRLKTGEFEGQISKIEGNLPANLQPGNGTAAPPKTSTNRNPNNGGGLQSPRDLPLRSSPRN